MQARLTAVFCLALTGLDLAMAVILFNFLWNASSSKQVSHGKALVSAAVDRLVSTVVWWTSLAVAGPQSSATTWCCVMFRIISLGTQAMLPLIKAWGCWAGYILVVPASARPASSWLMYVGWWLVVVFPLNIRCATGISCTPACIAWGWIVSMSSLLSMSGIEARGLACVFTAVSSSSMCWQAGRATILKRCGGNQLTPVCTS